MYLNKAMVYGNLTRDPEVKALPNGTQVCSFSIATNRIYKDRDGNKQEQVEYHNIVAFARLAEIIGQYLKKGRPIYIEGRMQTRSWEKDGVKQYRTEIVADNFQFGATAPGEGGGNGSSGATDTSSAATDGSEAAPAAPDYPEEDINPEDIPF